MKSETETRKSSATGEDKSQKGKSFGKTNSAGGTPTEATGTVALPRKAANDSAEKWILVVDDDCSVREMLSRVLVGEGYRVLVARDGAEALEIAAAHTIDLVMLDLNMPGQNGWDTFERLTMAQPLLAVIIITARSNQLFTALGAGVGALLEKPLDFPKLIEAVSRLLAEPPESRLARLTGRTPGVYCNSSHPKRKK